MLKLRLRNQAPGAGLGEFWLVEPRLVIGCAKECQLSVPDQGLNKQHAVIEIKGETLRLRALGQGIAVNGHPINEGEICALNISDKLDVMAISMDVVDPKLERRKASPSSQADPQTNDNEQWALKANHAALSDRVYKLSELVVVGRSSECDIVLAAAHLSRQHARLYIDQGALYVKDLGSSNGTFLNGVRVDEARVRRGDELAFDSLSFGVLGPSETIDRTIIRSAVNPTVARSMPSEQSSGAQQAASAEATAADPSRQGANHSKRNSPDEAPQASDGGINWLLIIAGLVVVGAGAGLAKFAGLIG